MVFYHSREEPDIHIQKIHFKKCKEKQPTGAGETAHRLRALVALPDLGSIPSTHMEVHNYM